MYKDALCKEYIQKVINKFVLEFIKTLEYDKIKKIIGLHDFGECCYDMIVEYTEMFNNKFDEYCKENKIIILKNDLLSILDFMKTYNKFTFFTFSINKHLYRQPFDEANLFIKSLLLCYDNNSNKYNLYINENLSDNDLFNNLQKICNIFNNELANSIPILKTRLDINCYSKIYLSNNSFYDCEPDFIKLFYNDVYYNNKTYFDMDIKNTTKKFSFNYNFFEYASYIENEEFFKNLLKLDIIKNV